jgi:FAD synthase
MTPSQSWKIPLQGEEKYGPPVVALGKFDALHRGHQSLAIAAVHLGGTPYLLSFKGMDKILGWEPRLPLVADCDRATVLESWKGVCSGAVPSECTIPFSEVHKMSPEEFVRLLAQDLCANGVVVGSNYRFGYRAAGTAETLKKIGEDYGMKVRILNLLEANIPMSRGVGEIVSSSKIRQGLSSGDMRLVELCMGRRYRLIAEMSDTVIENDDSALIKVDKFLNQLPRKGEYPVNVWTSKVCPSEDMAFQGEAKAIFSDEELLLQCQPGISQIDSGYLLLEFKC